MKYILFLMFFSAATTDPAKQFWTLQSSQSVEFEDRVACEKAGHAILSSVRTTNTMKVAVWCMASASQGGNLDIIRLDPQ